MDIFDDLQQDCGVSIADALEILQTSPWIWCDYLGVISSW